MQAGFSEGRGVKNIGFLRLDFILFRTLEDHFVFRNRSNRFYMYHSIGQVRMAAARLGGIDRCCEGLILETLLRKIERKRKREMERERSLL